MTAMTTSATRAPVERSRQPIRLTARVVVVVSELEIDELNGGLRVEQHQHDDEVGVDGALHAPGGAEQASDPVLAVEHPLEGEDERVVEEDQDERGHRRLRDP